MIQLYDCRVTRFQDFDFWGISVFFLGTLTPFCDSQRCWGAATLLRNSSVMGSEFFVSVPTRKTGPNKHFEVYEYVHL